MRNRRVSQRLRIKKRMRKRRIIFISLVIIIAFSLVQISGIFRINKLDISGNNVVKKSEIEKILNESIGKNYLLLNKGKSEKALLKIPYIKDVKFSYKFNNTLRVSIDERQDFLLIKGGTEYIADRNLKILGEKSSSKKELIVVEGIDTNKYEIGAYLFRNDENLKELSQKLLNSNIIFDISSIKFYKDSCDFTLKDGILVKFGPVNNFDYKLEMLEKIREDIKNTGKDVVSIDLFSNENPIVTLNGV